MATAALQDGPRFAELLGKTSFSFLEGASSPKEIVTTAKNQGMHSLAIVDRDGLYGSARVHVLGKEHGLRVITGAEVTLEGACEGSSVALLAIDHGGYGNLCRLLTQAHAGHDKGTAGVSVEQVAALSSGLVAVVPLDAGLAPSPGDELFGPIAEAFADRAFVATWRHLDGRDVARMRAATFVEGRYLMPLVASARPLYHHRGRKPLSDVLRCLRFGTTLSAAGTLLTPNAEAVLRGPEQMARWIAERPDAVARTVEIAEGCRFSLSELRYKFPSETMCRPGESADQALRRLVEEACRRRYGEHTPPDIAALLEKELGLIGRIGVAAYFLSVHEIVEIARSNKILCQGRGSAANSAVCFVLGVTAVDPGRGTLLFERFLSEERKEPPDIDVDFEHERREEVIQAIYDRYGRDRAAMVSEIISFRSKSALREVGKVFGLGEEMTEKLSGLVIHMDDTGFSPERLAEVGLAPDAELIQLVLRLASELDGFPRHLSIHVGGFVLSSEPLHHVAPIEPARMADRTVIPWDKDDLDELGFFKLDVLGLGMLTAIRKSLEILHAQKGDGERFDPIRALADIPSECPETYEAIQRADVVGVFQIESRAQMSMLPRLKPKEFYDLVIEVAIVRPGPIQGGMVHPYLRRRTGEEEVTYPHDSLKPILKRTLGVPLFQEQVMQLAMAGAGYSAGEADQLRRDMAAWKKTGRLERHRDKLLHGFAARGIDADFAERLYQQIHGFGEYGFPESHASSFALLVYASAWIKTHHPAEFACALLNSQPMGFYSPSSIVKDAQRHGIEVRPACVVASDWDSTLEDGELDEERDFPSFARVKRRPYALRLGLRQIRGIGEGAVASIVAARREKALTTLTDLAARAKLDRREIDAFAEAGALAALIPERREALFQTRAPREGGLFAGIEIETPEAIAGGPSLAPMRPIEQLSLDYGRVGLSIDDHPMRHVRERLAKDGVRRAKDLPALSHGTRLTVAGLVIGRQRPATASGVTFVTLEDETGMINVIVRRDLFAQNYHVARHAKLLRVAGRLERQGSVIHVLALAMARVRMPGGHDVPTRSRDFH